ncbi:MAG: DUF4290 domain-containing protein [Prevotella sp.]|jgi:hypothetical protein|nr:DUF4290 domain-containing protein [Prevotella sp.]
MDIQGLDYNTEREKMRLKAYGRDVQQMVEYAITLPTKAERQRCAESIIDTMKRVVPSQHSYKERIPMLWYHLALMSDFKLDIDYPVEFEHEDKMTTAPEKIEYSKGAVPVRHYGKLLFQLLDKLKEMPDGPMRDELAREAAEQMYRSLATWGFGSVDKERVVSDLARYTDGNIQLMSNDVRVNANDNANAGIAKSNSKRKKK